MNIIILRGISGSGKSTVAKRLFEAHAASAPRGWASIVSADNYFTNNHDEYNFDASKLGEAHNSCLRNFVTRLMLDSQELIIVDNTNTTDVEVATYAKLALAFGHHLETHTIECDVETAYRRNIHKIGHATVVAQSLRLKANNKKMRPEWNNRIVTP